MHLLEVIDWRGTSYYINTDQVVSLTPPLIKEAPMHYPTSLHAWLLKLSNRQRIHLSKSGGEALLGYLRNTK